MPQASVKIVPTKEKLTWPRDLYNVLQVGGLWKGSVGLATEQKDSLVSPGLDSGDGGLSQKTMHVGAAACYKEP